MPVTYDLEVTASKYLHQLGSGDVPLVFMFSGTCFTHGSSGFGVEQVPWHLEDSYRMPVAVWRECMDQHFPGSGWLRLSRDVLAELTRYKAEHGLTTLGLGCGAAAQCRTGGGAVSAEPVRPGRVDLDRIRAVADAVLYEGYLLYPYRATSRKNQVRWQFGVLGPQGAADAGIGEDSHSVDAVPPRGTGG